MFQNTHLYQPSGAIVKIIREISMSRVEILSPQWGAENVGCFVPLYGNTLWKVELPTPMGLYLSVFFIYMEKL